MNSAYHTDQMLDNAVREGFPRSIARTADLLREFAPEVRDLIVKEADTLGNISGGRPSDNIYMAVATYKRSGEFPGREFARRERESRQGR